MRNILLILTALCLPTSSLGFVAHQSHSQLAKLNGCVTTWSDYQQQHLDSLSTDYASVDLVPFDVLPDATLSKATNARAYWKELVKSSKANLHSMKAQEDVNEWSRHAPGHTENWVHYKNALDALIPHHHSTTHAFHWPKHASSASWSDYKEMVGGLAMPEVYLDKKQAEKQKDEKRSKADAYWQAKYKDDKEKQIHATAEAEEITEPSFSFRNEANLDTWGHYKHDYIDIIPPPKSPIEKELEELRKKATQFQALAVAETIGHTLAEEALHEAEERAASCEIAEAVLISAAAGGRLLVEEKEEGGAGV